MTFLDDRIQINITRETVRSLRSGFGTPFFLGDSLTTFPDKVKFYSDISEVAVDFADTDLEYIWALRVFGQEFTPNRVAIGQVTDSTTYLEAYLAIKDITTDFYTVNIDSNLSLDILALAAQIETENRLFMIGNGDVGIINNVPANILEQLNALNYDRTGLLYSSNAITQQSIGAWCGLMSTYVPGSATWAYKNLTGVTADDLTATQRDNVENANGNYYTFGATKNVTYSGVAVSGEYLDIIQGIDWLDYYIQLDMGIVFENAPKVPYNDQGITLFRNALDARLAQAVDFGIIEPDYKITTVAAADVPAGNKAAGLYTGLSFIANATGAIHNLVISGKLTI